MVSTFPLIEVAGSAYQLGFQHGAQAGDRVRRYLQLIERLTGQARQTLSRHAMALLPTIESLSPLLVQEIHGLADGARISFEEAVLCQVRTEAAHCAAEGCTLFAVRGSATADGQLLAGQNLDLEQEYTESAILLRVRPDDGRPAALLFTFAGQLGYSGINEHGLAHFNASLYDYHWRPGVSRQVLRRVLLEKRNVQEGIELLSRQRTCSAANLLLCDAQGGLADVEVRPEGIALYSDEHPDCLLHTNHYLTPEYTVYESGSLPDSFPRLTRLRAMITERWGAITLETLKEVLADHDGYPASICRHGTRNWHSIAGYIAEPARRLLHVRRGYGCQGVWQTYSVT